MKKKLTSLFGLLLTFVLCFSCIPANAKTDTPILDNAGVLYDSEISELSAYANQITNTYGFDIMLILDSNLENISSYSGDAYENYNLGIGENRDGIVFVFDTAVPTWYGTVDGFGVDAFTSENVTYIDNQVTPYLDSRDFYGACNKTLYMFESILSSYHPEVSDGDGSLKRVVDNADLLTDAEEQRLEQRISEISSYYTFEVVIDTENTFGGKAPTPYADDFYDYNGYGLNDTRDGILFAMCMDERDWVTSTTGRGITVFTDYMNDLIGARMVPFLKDGDYYGAFNTYLDMVENALSQARYGAPYDTNNRYPGDEKGKIKLSGALVFGVIILSIIIAFIYVGIQKGKLKTARPKQSAGDYIRPGSFTLWNRSDIFLYSHTTKTLRESSSSSGGGSSSHSSSSGSSHGGSSGKF